MWFLNRMWAHSGMGVRGQGRIGEARNHMLTSNHNCG